MELGFTWVILLPHLKALYVGFVKDYLKLEQDSSCLVFRLLRFHCPHFDPFFDWDKGLSTVGLSW